MTYVPEPEPGPISPTPPPQPSPGGAGSSTPPPQEQQPVPGKRSSGCASTAGMALVFLVAVGFAMWHVLAG
jgi:hypothetical protein